MERAGWILLRQKTIETNKDMTHMPAMRDEACQTKREERQKWKETV